jgi:hypothetical protein
VPPSSVTFVLIARIPPEGISIFAAYEDHVLPLLAQPGGVLQRRLHSEDGLSRFMWCVFPRLLLLQDFGKTRAGRSTHRN